MLLVGLKEAVPLDLSEEFRERFVRNLQGRDFILYGGLLELARQRGLETIVTKVLQIPSRDNQMYAVVEAQVKVDGQTYQEIGDASPQSVNRTIEPHILRMASTRAKARALRDAVGIDMVALEELGGSVDNDTDRQGVSRHGTPEDYIIDFGKYASMTLGDIASIDKGYVEWLGDNAKNHQLKTAARQLLGTIEH